MSPDGSTVVRVDGIVGVTVTGIAVIDGLRADSGLPGNEVKLPPRELSRVVFRPLAWVDNVQFGNPLGTLPGVSGVGTDTVMDPVVGIRGSGLGWSAVEFDSGREPRVEKLADVPPGVAGVRAVVGDSLDALTGGISDDGWPRNRLMCHFERVPGWKEVAETYQGHWKMAWQSRLWMSLHCP